MNRRHCIPVYIGTLLLPLAGGAAEPADADVAVHVAPPPPAQPMPAMSDADMERVMDMHDDPLLVMIKADQLERAFGDHATTVWDAEAWVGHDFDKLWLRSEGEREPGGTDARVEAFWDHAFAAWWDWQLGVRRDVGSGPQRNWAAFGIQGLAPYWFEIEATAYLGEGGRTAARLRVQYELLLTQRLIVQPEMEANLYGRRDAARGIDAGLNDVDIGLRLRYEIRRELAPYVGVVWKRRFGAADSFPGAGSGSDTQLVAGVRIWF